MTYRRQGDDGVLVEYGAMTLDLGLRARVHALHQHLLEVGVRGVTELTPGVRSLQIRVDTTVMPVHALLDLLTEAEQRIPASDRLVVPSRTVHLPLSWDDPATREAITRYMHGVRADAPWCPWNIEFIRRMNGLASVQDVYDTVFGAEYLVLGLGDVYLGAPVATPTDPRHRLVTTKYNPARTWTPENAVGIGGAYLCIYGMEGPGGYQFVGRTTQVWNHRHPGHASDESPGCCAISIGSTGIRSRPMNSSTCAPISRRAMSRCGPRTASSRSPTIGSSCPTMPNPSTDSARYRPKPLPPNATLGGRPVNSPPDRALPAEELRRIDGLVIPEFLDMASFGLRQTR